MFNARPPSRPSVLSILPILPDTDERPVFVTLPFAKISHPHYLDEKHFPVFRYIPDVVKFAIERNWDPVGLPCINHVMQAKLTHPISQEQAEDPRQFPVVTSLAAAICFHVDER
jgi:hypothetical protein